MVSNLNYIGKTPFLIFNGTFTGSRDKDVDTFERTLYPPQSSRAPAAAPRKAHAWDTWDPLTADFGLRTL